MELNFDNYAPSYCSYHSIGVRVAVKASGPVIFHDSPLLGSPGISSDPESLIVWYPLTAYRTLTPGTIYFHYVQMAPVTECSARIMEHPSHGFYLGSYQMRIINMRRKKKRKDAASVDVANNPASRHVRGMHIEMGSGAGGPEKSIIRD